MDSILRQLHSQLCMIMLMDTAPIIDFLLFLEVLKDEGEGVMKIGTLLEI